MGKRRNVHGQGPSADGASTHAEMSKAKDILAALESSPPDLDALRDLSLSQGGLINSELRIRAWPLLLGVVGPDLPDFDELPMKHREVNQVELDVDRSFWRFPDGLDSDTITATQKTKQMQRRGTLTQILNAVLACDQERHYYQGFHEICAVIMLNTDPKMALGLVSRLSSCHIKDHVAPTLENAMAHCDLIYPLLARTKPELYAFITRSEVQPQVVISWMLTWFAHDIDDMRLVSRIYDACIASHPFYPVYIATALFESKEARVLGSQCEFSSVHKLLMSVDVDNVGMEDVLTRAAEIYKSIPPKVAVTLPKLSDRSRYMLTKSGAVLGYERLRAGQAKGGVLPTLLAHSTAPTSSCSISSPLPPAAGNNSNQSLTRHLRGLLKHTITVSVTAVGVTIGSLFSQALLEGLFCLF